jgi:hypothetical protein
MARKRPDAPTEGQTNTPSPRKPPAHEVRVGRIKGTCWRNVTEGQGEWFSVTITRSYKDTQDKWHTAHSYGRDDLLVIAEVCRLCWLWIATQTGAQGVGDICVPSSSSTSGDEEPLPM